MFPAERRRQIVQRVNEQGSLSIPQLSRLFNVSEMTIHRDLDALANMGLLYKTRGGALASEKQIVPFDYQQRLNSYPLEKDVIGHCAAQFIHNGDTILLEAGTTSLSVACHCRNFDNLTVYTNGPMVALELAQVQGVEVYSTGGLLSKLTMAYVGPEAERVISQIRPDKCFLGANGFTLQDGVTDPLPLEASIKRKMVEVSQEVYLVITPDKFGHVAPHVSVPVDAIDIIILHKDTPEHYFQELTDHNVRYVIA